MSTSFKAIQLLNATDVQELVCECKAPFTTVIVDEAGLISRAAVAALSFLASRRVLLVGDPETTGANQQNLSSAAGETGDVAGAERTESSQARRQFAAGCEVAPRATSDAPGHQPRRVTLSIRWPLDRCAGDERASEHIAVTSSRAASRHLVCSGRRTYRSAKHPRGSRARESQLGKANHRNDPGAPVR